MIRDMLYEAGDFRRLSQYDVSRAALLLIERPGITLDFITPKEAIANLRQEFLCKYQ